MTKRLHRKIDPLLHGQLNAAPLVLGAAELASAPVTVLIDFAGSRAELESLGVVVESFADGIATGSLDAAQLTRLADDRRVRAVEAARPLASELDLSATTVGADVVQRPPLSLSGRGVIIGVIDTGIDLWHPAFRRADGRSAVIELWDQTLSPVASEQHPAGFGYGVVYDQAQINQALAAGRSTALLRHRDTHGHGTHVASIAAGSALPYQGIAPATDLIVVATSSDAKALGDSARTLDAIRYVYARAAKLGRPAVVNLSLGSYLGPHDGTSLLERGIDALLAAPGRALIKAAGNAGGAGCHASGSLKRNQTAVLPIEVAGGADATIDVWYAAAGRFEIIVGTPDGTATAPVGGDEVRELFLPNGNQVAISSILDNPANGDNRIYLVLGAGSRGNLEAGRWTVTLQAKQRRGAARFDAWIERGSAPPRFAASIADERMTVSVPGTARRCIAVAAFADRTAGHTP
ncbi:MAG: S8 family serine peptidase, partial [Roseiflexaceae bacterium]|nr:S8 family serine peptidase [Roseiflexaceae bacterium]